MAQQPNNKTYRRMRADQESLMPGLAYVGAAAIGGSVLVNRTRSMPVKIVTPLAMAAIAGSYFLPAHTDLLKPSWMLSSSSTTTTSNPTSMNDLKRSANEAAIDLSHKTAETVEDLTLQSQATWDDLKRKGENLAGAYRDVGLDQVNKVVETSAHEAQSWLDKQKAEADKLLSEAASVLSSTSSKLSPLPHQNKSSHRQVPENPSSSRWSWWRTSDNVATKSELESTINKETSSSTKDKPLVRRPSTSATSTKPQKVVIDKAVSHAAIKGHDDLINRTSLIGKNAEESAIKVHDNVIDAALPRDRQTPKEKHHIEISRQASQSDLRDGQFIVKKTGDAAAEDGLPKRVRRGSTSRKDDHGLQNLDKRAHMLYDGVEHIEHSLNKKMEKALQEEADFWHQQSLKEEANARTGERGV